MKGVQCYELFGGIALTIHTFSFSFHWIKSASRLLKPKYSCPIGFWGQNRVLAKPSYIGISKYVIVLFKENIKQIIKRDFQCYSSEKIIAQNTLTRFSPAGTHFTADSTEATRIMCLAQGHNILLPGFEPSTSVSRSRHSNYMTNMLQL